MWSEFLLAVGYLTAEILVETLTIGFTSPSSRLRVAAIPILAGYVWYAFPMVVGGMPRIAWAGIVGGYMFGQLWHFIDVALLSRWSFAARGPTRGPSARAQTDKASDDKRRRRTRDSWWARLTFGLDVATSSRCCGTPFEVKNVPPFSARDPAYVPSRAVFLRQAVSAIVFYYLTMDLLSLGDDPAKTAVFFAPEKIPIFSRRHELSAEELIVRFVGCMFFVFSARFFVTILANLIAIVAVALLGQDVRHWRPVYGPLKEAYSIRQFWGVTWHQMLRQRFTNLNIFLIQDVLKLRKGSWLAQCAAVFLPFLISGVLHVVSDVGLGIAVRDSGALRFFLMQAVGILLEDGVQRLYRAAFGLKRDENRSPTLFARCVGYIWLLTFMAWIAPGWIYPAIFITGGGPQDPVLPFSILRPAIGMVKSAWKSA